MRPLVLMWAAVAAAASTAADVNYDGRKIGGVWYHAIVANLNSDDVKMSGLVNREVGRSEPFWQMLSRSKATVAVSGTFFDTRSARPIGSIVIEGDGKVDGFHGSCLAIDYFNQAKVLDPKWGRHFDTSPYRYLVRGGVRLITGGEITVYPRAQRFKDPRVWSKTRRVAVGVTGNNKLIVVATNGSVLLRSLANAMKAYGARNAIALDGGGSAAMYYRGKILVKPSRKLTNLLTLHEAPGAAWSPLPTPSGGVTDKGG
ncbi:MAG: phosphodiester glycosidase family protein [Fimbriimonadales bacterium]